MCVLNFKLLYKAYEIKEIDKMGEEIWKIELGSSERLS